MRRYTKEHEWVFINEDEHDDEAVIGISEYAAKELGDITFVELPESGEDIILGDPAAVIESVKAASDLYTPVSGSIVAVNEKLEEEPSLVNDDPEGEGWICKLSHVDLKEIEDLMDEEEYKKFLASK